MWNNDRVHTPHTDAAAAVRYLFCSLLLGCSGSAALSDASTTDAPVARMAEYVGSGSTGPTAASSTISIPTAQAGDLIVVVISTTNAAAQLPDPFLDANDYSKRVHAHADESNCQKSVTLWSFGNVPEGTAGIRIENTGDSLYVAYGMIFTGLRSDAGGRLQPYGTATFPAGDIATAPAVSASNGTVVVSAVVSCATIDALSDANSFTEIGIIDGSSAAYAFPSTAGAYAAAWSQSTGTWAGVTVVFE